MENDNLIKYNVYVSTNVGKVRRENEDNFAVNTTIKSINSKNQNIRRKAISEPLMCSVFDGMGGESNGEEASEIAALVSVEFFKYIKKSGKFIEKCIDSFVGESSNEIIKAGNEKKVKRSGSTFAMAYCCDGIIKTFSLGDSRIYLYSNNFLRQISNDHTLAVKKYLANIYTMEEAKASPDKHKLTAFLGLDEEHRNKKAEHYPDIKLEQDEKLVICTDGLYDMCSDDEILEMLKNNDENLTANLVNKALEKGGEDNVTCMIIERAQK